AGGAGVPARGRPDGRGGRLRGAGAGARPGDDPRRVHPPLRCAGEAPRLHTRAGVRWGVAALTLRARLARVEASMEAEGRDRLAWLGEQQRRYLRAVPSLEHGRGNAWFERRLAQVPATSAGWVAASVALGRMTPDGTPTPAGSHGERMADPI